MGNDGESTFSKKILLLMFVITISSIPTAFAQETQVPGDLPINWRTSDFIIIGIGILGGLTTAGLGIAKNRNKVQENKKLIDIANKENAPAALKIKMNQDLETSLKFDWSKFGRTMVVATVTGGLLAVAAATTFTELNVITMFMIFAASMGMSSISKPGSK